MTHETHHFLIAEHHVQLSFVPSKHNGMQLVPSLKHFRAKGDDLPEPLLAITVDDGLQPLPKQERHRIRTFDTGNGDTIVDRTDNGSYQFIIKDIEGRDCCLLIADHDFHDCHMLTCVLLPVPLWAVKA